MPESFAIADQPTSRRHEGLVNILQVGRDDSAGFFYCVMELADDAETATSSNAPENYRPLTLEERIRQRGRLPVSECARIGASVAAFLPVTRPSVAQIFNLPVSVRIDAVRDDFFGARD